MKTSQAINYTAACMALKALVLTMFTAQGKAEFTFLIEKSLLPGPTYPLSYLPLFDGKTNGLLLLSNEFALKFQLRCILLGEPCDLIGRWLKSRIEKMIFERKCPVCTSIQSRLLEDWVFKFTDLYPELFRAAVAQYVENAGIELPLEEQIRTRRALKAP